ncbi:glycosyltransferase family 4 protein [Chaetomium tenue]|uniref:Glycosyltransferase family 4 protein n=1 Tax=Chaetomium tenue TaxID=1854479 RepID=A0ACB7NU42_9PEZI|nr:glycosyltransferase family 4 protein [Chaetomium globosum]
MFINMAGDKKPGKTIVFLHPDLGIGGAERLVVDAAVGLQKCGHKVVIFTSHCDPTHCFDEARDGTLDVRVRGNTLVPPSLLGRFAILCAILRQLHLIIHITLLTPELRDLAPDAFFVDQLSAGLPLLKTLTTAAPIFFYCHFPDLLLVRGRAHLAKRLYRVPFDALERWSMGFADAIAANSEFTRGIVAQTWPGLVQQPIQGEGKGGQEQGSKANGRQLHVVYPCIDTTPPTSSASPLPWKKDGVILSINRFERKKNIALALHAFALLPPHRRHRAKLVLAGGYDPRVAENVAYHAELTALASSLGLRHATAKTVVSAVGADAGTDQAEVVFLLSVPQTLKAILLRTARLLVYTPSNEHFGIVPLEAMLAGVVVLAADSGGPRETVVEGVTGWLRDPEKPEAWSAVMDRVLNEMGEGELEGMGRAGVERVKGRFAEDQMAERLEGIFEGMKRAPGVSGVSVLMAGLVAVVGLVIPLVLVGRIARQ